MQLRLLRTYRWEKFFNDENGGDPWILRHADELQYTEYPGDLVDDSNWHPVKIVETGEPEHPDIGIAREAQDALMARMGKVVEPVDTNARELVSGKPVSEDHRDINPVTGMQKDYVVLSTEERAKGFVKPVRREYTHKTCDSNTTMALAIAETYARSPNFYSGTFCTKCRAHFPLDQFVWRGTDESLGS